MSCTLRPGLQGRRPPAPQSLLLQSFAGSARLAGMPILVASFILSLSKSTFAFGTFNKEPKAGGGEECGGRNWTQSCLHEGERASVVIAQADLERCLSRSVSASQMIPPPT